MAGETIASPVGTIAGPLRRAIAGEVVRLLHDPAARGRVVRSSDALFAPDSVVWRVHGDVAGMMIGGVSGLLLQMLHPAVLAGVWDHSAFRNDMIGRLRRTARFIAVTTYAARDEAEAAIARVRGIHRHVAGTRPDGRPYAASDPRLLAWVHATETTSFLAAYIRYAEPRMSGAEQDLYFAGMYRVGEALGADPVPRSRREAYALIDAIRPELAVDARTREVARLVLGQPAQRSIAAPLQSMTMQAAVDLLPGWARTMHALPSRPLRRPLVRAGTLGLARTLRWAFA